VPRTEGPAPARAGVDSKLATGERPLQPAPVKLPTLEADPAPRGRKERTQERIVGAAVSLFASHGYEGTSISAIAAEAGVSRSVIFWHFGDKEGLFREGFRRMLVPFFHELQAKFEHIPPRQRIFEMVSAYERVVGEHEEAIRSIVMWLLESEKLRAALLTTLFGLHDSLVRDIREAFGEICADDDAASELGAAIVALLDGNLLLGMLDPSARNREVRRAGLRRLTALVVAEVAD
jgi:AcrR family transcriptional regulator